MTRGLSVLAVLLVVGSSALGQSTDTMTIKVFFHNEKFNPNAEDCNKVFPTPRTIARTKAVARAALDELFNGTTEEERKNEFWSYPAVDTKDIIKSLNIRIGWHFLISRRSYSRSSATQPRAAAADSIRASKKR